MKQELERLLLQKEEFLVEGALNKNKLAELARQYDSMLLNLLMSEPTISNHFFSTLEEGILIFKKDTFLQFLNNKEFLPDSFTATRPRLGLRLAIIATCQKITKLSSISLIKTVY